MLVQNEELKKLSISRRDCINEINFHTSKIIKECFLVVKEHVDHLFKLNFCLSELDMLLAVTRFSSMQQKNYFPDFKNTKNDLPLKIDDLNDPLLVGEKTH